MGGCEGTEGTSATKPGRRAVARRPAWPAAGTRWILALATAAAVSGAGDATAQETPRPGVLPPPTVAVVGGWFNRTDFHGEGPSSLFGLRFRLPLTAHLVVEPGVHYTSFPPDATSVDEGEEDPQELLDEDVKMVLLDFQLQLRFRYDRLQPYVGLGAGGAVDFRDDRAGSEFLVSTFTGAAGATFDVGGGFFLMAEARYRTLDELATDGLVDAVLGVGLEL